MRKFFVEVNKKFLIEKHNWFLTWPLTMFIRYRDLTYVSFILGERTYDPQYFHCRVNRIKIDDHNVPSLRYFYAKFIVRDG